MERATPLGGGAQGRCVAAVDGLLGHRQTLEDKGLTELAMSRTPRYDGPASEGFRVPLEAPDPQQPTHNLLYRTGVRHKVSRPDLWCLRGRPEELRLIRECLGFGVELGYGNRKSAVLAAILTPLIVKWRAEVRRRRLTHWNGQRIGRNLAAEDAAAAEKARRKAEKAAGIERGDDVLPSVEARREAYKPTTYE